jgi:hypothetical protein
MIKSTGVVEFAANDHFRIHHSKKRPDKGKTTRPIVSKQKERTGIFAHHRNLTRANKRG